MPAQEARYRRVWDVDLVDGSDGLNNKLRSPGAEESKVSRLCSGVGEVEAALDALEAVIHCGLHGFQPEVIPTHGVDVFANAVQQPSMILQCRAEIGDRPWDRL